MKKRNQQLDEMLPWKFCNDRERQNKERQPYKRYTERRNIKEEHCKKINRNESRQRPGVNEGMKLLEREEKSEEQPQYQGNKNK